MIKFKWVKNYFKEPAGLIGVDVGATAIKLVELKQEQGCCQLVNYASVPLPAAAVVEKDIKDPRVVTTAIQQVLTTANFVSKRAALALPDSFVISKVLQLESHWDEVEMEEQIWWEAQHHIPYPVEEIYLDFQIMGINRDNPKQNDVLLIAARKDQIAARMAVLAEGGLEIVAVDVESHAIARWYKLLAKPLLPAVIAPLIAIVDIGATLLTLTLLRDDQVLFTRSDVLHVDEILLQLRRSLQFFFSNYQQEQLAGIVVTGGGALMANLQASIEEQLGVPSFVINSFATLTVAEKIDQSLLVSIAPCLTLSCGLALRIVS